MRISDWSSDVCSSDLSVSDVLNKVHLESLDNAKIGAVLSGANIECKGTGSLKRLQALLASAGDPTRVNILMSPFYTLYDFRVAYSHLGSSEGSAATMKTVADRDRKSTRLNSSH